MARGMESDEALPDVEGQKWTCRQHVQQELTNSWMERHTINAATSGQGRQTFIAQRGEVIAPQLGKYLRDSPPLLALQVCDSAWSLFIEFYLIQFTLLNRRILNWHWDVFFLFNVWIIFRYFNGKRFPMFDFHFVWLRKWGKAEQQFSHFCPKCQCLFSPNSKSFWHHIYDFNNRLFTVLDKYILL